MENNNDFPKGIIAKAGNVDFVKAKLSFKVDEFIATLKENEKNGWVNLDVLESKAGKIYTKFNVFEPKTEAATETATETSDDLPF